MKRLNNRAFTIMEVLIIVAIIAILVSVSIPVFASQLEKSRAATCMANRRSLKIVLAATLMTEPEDAKVKADNFTQTQKSFALTSDMAKEYTCPKGGTISYTVNYETDVVTVYCSVHAPGGITQSTIEAIKKLLSDNNLWTTIDSGAVEHTDTSKNKFLAALKAAGLDLNTMGAKSWRITGGNEKMIEWTTQDIAAMNEGDKIIIMRCRLDYNNNPYTYTVWQGTVQAKTGEYKENDEKKKTEKYNIIGYNNAKQFTTDNDNKADLEAIKKIYNNNSKNYNADAMN